MNLALWLQRTAQIHGPAPAVARGFAVVYRYHDLAGTAARAAAWLVRRGVAAGDRVGLFMDNAPDYIALLWGVWWAGAVAVPMNARLHGREAAWILGHSGAALVFCDQEHDAQLADAGVAPSARAGDFAFLHDDSLPGAQIAECGEDATAWLFYTSGTTGKPKGVMLSHRNLRWATMAYLATVQPVQPGGSLLHPAPLSHGSGLYHLPYVLQGGVNVVPASGGLDCAEFFALATHWRNASCFAAPTIVKRLSEWARAHPCDTSGLAAIVYGGAPMYLADIEAARAVIGPHFAQIYGQGESPMTISVLPGSVIEDTRHPRWRARMASVGFAQPMVEIAIRSGDGVLFPNGTPGEVINAPSITGSSMPCPRTTTARCSRPTCASARPHDPLRPHRLQLRLEEAAGAVTRDAAIEAVLEARHHGRVVVHQRRQDMEAVVVHHHRHAFVQRLQ